MRLRALLESGGASFYDDDGNDSTKRNFLKAPMVSLVAVGQRDCRIRWLRAFPHLEKSW